MNTKSCNQGASREVDTGGNWASPRPRALPAGRAVSAWNVIKKHAPVQPGALKLAQQWGDALVCSRHWLDETGQTRVTTVKLVVEQASVRTPGGAGGGRADGLCRERPAGRRPPVAHARKSGPGAAVDGPDQGWEIGRCGICSWIEKAISGWKCRDMDFVLVGYIKVRHEGRDSAEGQI